MKESLKFLGLLGLLGLWAVYIIGCLLLPVGVIWVAIHFLRKVW
jgi:hypothetical protein